jgi:putative tricarboxylic transport membrane protein
MRRADLILGIVVTIAGALALEMALHLAMFAQSGSPGPGFFPRLITILLTGLGVILVVTSVRPRSRAEHPGRAEAAPTGEYPVADGEVAVDGRRMVLRAGSVWLLFSLAVPLVEILGFVPAAAAFVYVLLFALEKRRGWRAVLVAVAMPIAASFIFTVLLKIQLPQGALSHLPLGI